MLLFAKVLMQASTALQFPGSRHRPKCCPSTTLLPWPRTLRGIFVLPEQSHPERTNDVKDPCRVPRPWPLNPAVPGACQPLAIVRDGEAPFGLQVATLSATSVFSSPSLALEPAFENICPEPPIRPPLADSKCAGYRAFSGVPSQGAGSNAKHSSGLCQADRAPFVERGKDHLASQVLVRPASCLLHPRAVTSTIPESSV
jgi:hypothetical protein